ncbi:hypothetical protein ZWY2020_017410, partial [Hordeum vulgare]
TAPPTFVAARLSPGLGRSRRQWPWKNSTWRNRRRRGSSTGSRQLPDKVVAALRCHSATRGTTITTTTKAPTETMVWRGRAATRTIGVLRCGRFWWLSTYPTADEAVRAYDVVVWHARRPKTDLKSLRSRTGRPDSHGTTFVCGRSAGGGARGRERGGGGGGDEGGGGRGGCWAMDLAPIKCSARHAHSHRISVTHVPPRALSRLATRPSASFLSSPPCAAVELLATAAAEPSPRPRVVTDKDRRRNRRRERRLSIAEMDENAMEAWRLQFPHDILDGRQFFVQRRAKRAEQAAYHADRRTWKQAALFEMELKEASTWSSDDERWYDALITSEESNTGVSESDDDDE